MFDAMMSALNVFLTTLGVIGGADLASLGGVTGTLAVAITLVTAAVVLLAVVARAHATPGGSSPPHPRRAIDVSTLLPQSDPDAPGHPRPRAPQSVATAT